MELLQKCRKIKLLVTDVDGVLTNGGIIYGQGELELKIFNVKDGYICQYLLAAGIKLAIITGRWSDVVERRAVELKFNYVVQGASDKLKELKKLQEKEALRPEEIAYIGDDLNDLETMNYVGLSAAPNDAFDYIKSEVDFVCSRKGGDAAFREFADLILKSREMPA